MEKLKNSLRILNRNIMLLAIVAIVADLPALYKHFEPKPGIFVVLTNILSIIIIWGVFSALWQYAQEGKYNFLGGIKKDISRLLASSVVEILLVGGALIFILLLLSFTGVFEMFNVIPIEFANSVAPFSIIFFVYAYSYVIVKGRSGDAPIKSVKYVRRNFKKSLYPIAIFLISRSLIPNIVDMLPADIEFRFFFLMPINFISFYFMYLSFLVACSILDNDRTTKNIS